MKKLLSGGLRFLASYGFAVVILFFLTLDTLFGTLAQVQHGLFEAQKIYFESFWLVHPLNLGFVTVPLPLPGGYLLMILLFCNLLAGGIIRARKDWKTPGILISHCGILFMLFGGGVTFWSSTNGYMRLHEGEESDFFVSHYDWEVSVAEMGPGGKEFIIQHDFLMPIAPEGEREFKFSDFPFDLRLSNFYRNSNPATAPNAPLAVDGIALIEAPLETEAAQNAAGCYATVVSKDGGGELRGLLYGFTRGPWTFELDGQQYGIELRHTRYVMDPPFTIRLDDFEMNHHPGTGMASNYSSDVTKIEGGNVRNIHIKMNEPLRHHGYTFFQSSYGPPGSQPGDPNMYSVFSVVKNPADQWPKWACYIIGFGMSLHFLQKLLKYLKREKRSQQS